MKEFLVNERSRALLHLVDAFKLSESELQDVWDGVFNRISELRVDYKSKTTDVMCECYRCRGLGVIDVIDDTSEDECPVCGGSGEIFCDEIELDDDDTPVEVGDLETVWKDIVIEVSEELKGNELETTYMDLYSLEHEDVNVSHECTRCKGDGYISVICEEGLEDKVCPECDGTGL